MIVIDRIENAVAIVEIDGETIDIPLKLLPAGVKEGDLLKLILCDNEETHLQKENEERLKRLQERDSGDMNIDL